MTRFNDHSRKPDADTGSAGELAAAIAVEWQARRAVGHRRPAIAEAAVAELNTWVNALAQGALLVAGYHRHDRGHWRRRRAKR